MWSRHWLVSVSLPCQAFSTMFSLFPVLFIHAEIYSNPPFFHSPVHAYSPHLSPKKVFASPPPLSPFGRSDSQVRINLPRSNRSTTDFCRTFLNYWRWGCLLSGQIPTRARPSRWTTESYAAAPSATTASPTRPDPPLSGPSIQVGFC